MASWRMQGLLLAPQSDRPLTSLTHPRPSCWILLLIAHGFSLHQRPSLTCLVWRIPSTPCTTHKHTHTFSQWQAHTGEQKAGLLEWDQIQARLSPSLLSPTLVLCYLPPFFLLRAHSPQILVGTWTPVSGSASRKPNLIKERFFFFFPVQIPFIKKKNAK